MIDSNKGELRQLTIDIPSLTSHAIWPKWTPDGHKIVFQLNYYTEEGTSGSPHAVPREEIWVVNAAGTGLTRLTDAGPDICPDSPYGGNTGPHFENPTPSPDGHSMLAYKFTFSWPDSSDTASMMASAPADDG